MFAPRLDAAQGLGRQVEGGGQIVGRDAPLVAPAPDAGADDGVHRINPRKAQNRTHGVLPDAGVL
ncbi:hypothetical protein D3C80_1721420 [compost metagenome]